MPLDLHPGDLEIVRGILSAFVPDREVRAFGSRVTWRARPGSDLDLAVCGQAPLSEARLAALRDAFSSSNLPCKVDVVDAASVAPGFLRIIGDSSEMLQAGVLTPALVAAGWRQVRLGDVCRLVPGVQYRQRPPTRRERAPLPASLPLVGLRELAASPARGTADGMQNRQVSAESVVAGPGRTPFVPAGTTALAARGLALGSSRRRLLTCDTVLGSGVIGLVPDPERVDARFLFHALERIDLRLLARGSAIPHVTPADLEDLRLLVPPLSTQRDIGRALGAFDELIELNLSLQATLEATVRTILEARTRTLGGHWPQRGRAMVSTFALRPLLRRQRHAAAQCAVLTALRAALLPRLTSGAISLCSSHHAGQAG